MVKPEKLMYSLHQLIYYLFYGPILFFNVAHAPESFTYKILFKRKTVNLIIELSINFRTRKAEFRKSAERPPAKLCSEEV